MRIAVKDERGPTDPEAAGLEKLSFREMGSKCEISFGKDGRGSSFRDISNVGPGYSRIWRGCLNFLDGFNGGRK